MLGPVRHVWSVAGVTLLLAGLATACHSTPGSSSAAVRDGGTLRFATDQQPACLDPAVSPQDITALIDRNVFDSLVRQSADGAFHPWLAKRWSVSPDGMTYTFFLRSGVRFHDGTVLDAAAVKASLDHVVAPDTKSLYAARLIGAYRDSRVVDPTTVQVRLGRPDTPFLQAVSTAYLGIQSPRALRGGSQQLCTRPVGSGPFKFVSWTKNSSLSLTRNQAYAWAPQSAGHTGPARLDGITISFITDNSARFGALTSGQADVIDDVPPADVATLKAMPALRYHRTSAPGLVYTTFLNATSGPLADERVRTALLRSVDLDSLVKSTYFGQFDRAWSVLSPTTTDYQPSTEGSWKFDRKLADMLLDSAGWTGRDSKGYRTKDGQRLTLRWPYVPQLLRTFTVLAQGIQAQAKQVGIQLDFASVDVGTFGQAIAHRSLDMYTTSFVRSEPDIMRIFFTSGEDSTKGGGNVFGLTDRSLDGWLDGAAASSDQVVRGRDYRAAQSYVIQHALAMPAYVPADLLGASSRVHGLAFDPNAYPLFYDAWLAAGR